jgi:hypothetical protein
MPEWLMHFLNSFANQAGTWLIGAVLAMLGLFSARILERIKFALNRADLRVKYYEEMATEMSHFVFVIDRLIRVYYGSNWATEEDKGAIANEYNEVMNAISRKEYVYLSWLHRYWGQRAADAFAECMQKVRGVDLILIRLNEASDEKGDLVAELKTAQHGLQRIVHTLLVATI